MQERLQACDAGKVRRALRVRCAIEEHVEGREARSVGARALPPIAACRSNTRGRPLARAAYSSPAISPDQLSRDNDRYPAIRWTTARDVCSRRVWRARRGSFDSIGLQPRSPFELKERVGHLD